MQTSCREYIQLYSSMQEHIDFKAPGLIYSAQWLWFQNLSRILLEKKLP